MFLRDLSYLRRVSCFALHLRAATRFSRRPLSHGKVDQARARNDRRHDDPRQFQHGASSIRPITVFAFCIPLGYAVKWALEDDKRSNGSTVTADGFVRYTLVAKEDVSSTNAIFTLRPAKCNNGLDIPKSSEDQPKQVTSVEIKQPQLQIARSYTLLPTRPEHTNDTLQLLIRKEQHGEVSGYLHRLTIGSELEIRGPHAEYVLPDKVDRVVFLAGGTGIAPALQVAKALVTETEVRILWANRKRGDCIGGTSDNVKASAWKWFTWSTRVKQDATHDAGVIVRMLQDMKHQSKRANNGECWQQLQVDYFVDEEGTFIQPRDVRTSLASIAGRPNSGNPDERLKQLLVVSGPPGFVAYWAGPKVWTNGREAEGPLGGVLSSMDLKGWTVVKM